jgi:hypothetical protein
MEGLYIMDLNEKGITAHPKVLQFYADMEVHQQTARLGRELNTIV